MIRHGNHSVEENPLAIFAQAVFENQIASCKGQDHPRSSAEGDEQITVGLLQMWQPPSVPIFR
jgi:hypothetical protein